MENICPGCESARQQVIKNLKAALDALEDPKFGHALIENAGAELFCVVGEVNEVIRDFAESEAAKATAARAGASTSGAEFEATPQADDDTFFDQFKDIDA
jgi:hypothetical protein